MAAKIGVNERDLRRREGPISAKTTGKIRDFFQNQSVDTGIATQSDIFSGEIITEIKDGLPGSKILNVEEMQVRTIRSYKKDSEKEKLEVNTESGLAKRPDIKKEEDINPLSEKEAETLILQHEYIRDPVHKDIWITALEREIIDSAAFQRLHGLKQLGPTYLVYPGATHSRFLHSIGTLHCAEQMIEIVNRNYKIYERPFLLNVGPYQHLLIRVCALLHDLAHMPYGHTLESEGNLREKEWKDSSRLELWLGSDDKSKKSVAKTIKDFLCKSGISEEKAIGFIDDIRKYIPVNKEKQADYLMNLEYPFIVDIVGNTLCADLLDYLDRDMYYCGLREKSGDRVTKYLAVVRVNSSNDDNTHFKQADSAPGKGRIVLLAYRVEREHSPTGGSKIVQKSEIHSEAIDLLRRRYALAEKVYFHRTKIAASAMLISATASASIDFQDIFDISDEAFISKLANDNNPRTKRLITKYKARQLYKLAYEIKYHPRQDEGRESLMLHDEWYPLYRKPKWRQEKEAEIENIAGLPEGSVVIYCPELGMNLKQFEMLVQNRPDSEIKPLKDILDLTRQKEMTAINERFEQLWKLQIFVDPEVIDAATPSRKLDNFSKICEEIMGFPNQRSDLDYDFKGVGRPIDDQIALRVMEEYEMKNDIKVPVDLLGELVDASRRARGSSRIEQCREHLEAIMKSNK
ncbi:MAG: hypothetical protein WCA51_07640 [Dehalococcoidia bacterium]